MKLNYSAVKRRRLNHAEFLDLVYVFEYCHAASSNRSRIDEQMKFVNQSCFIFCKKKNFVLAHNNTKGCLLPLYNNKSEK